MRTTIHCLVAVCGLALGSLPANALEFVAPPQTPEDAPEFAPLWQKARVEVGDTHWGVAENYAIERGLIPDATVAPGSPEARTVYGILLTIFNSDLNEEAKWEKDPNGWPALILGREYYIPVTQAVNGGTATPDEVSAAEGYFQEQRNEIANRIDEFNASLAEIDLDSLRDDLVGQAELAARLEAVEQQSVGLTDGEAEQLATASEFVTFLKTGRFDEAAEFQETIQTMIDEAVEKEAEARSAADDRLGARIDGVTQEGGAIDTRVGTAIENLRGELFDDQGNLIVPETDVMGILEREGLVADGQPVFDPDNYPWFGQLFDADGNALFASKSELDALKTNLGPLASMPWFIWAPALLGLLGLMVAVVVWVSQHGLRSMVRQNTADIEDLQSLALKDLEWHPENRPKFELNNLTPGEDGATTWRVRPVGTTDWCTVRIGRTADTKKDYVLTDLKRNAGDDEPIATPFSLKGNKLQLSILKAIKRKALVPTPAVASHSAAA